MVPLTIPPLRERREDILPLAEHFLRKHEPKGQRGLFRIAPEFAAQLEIHDWPGNVRELENLVRRALALATSSSWSHRVSTPPDLLPATSTPDAVKSGVTLENMERQLLEKTLEATHGNRTRAAQLMGVSLRTVRNKIREYGLPAWRAS